MTDSTEDLGSRLLRAVDLIAISPDDATAIAEGYILQSRQKFPNDSEWNHQLRAANKIIGRYSKIAMNVGGASALPGIIPGLGTAVTIVGGSAADILVTMKLQVDMSMCLAAAFKYEIHSEDRKHLAFLIAATGSLQRAGVEGSVKLGSTAGVSMLRQYLKGGALQATKLAFRKVGITFTRKAAEKAIPFGVGVVVGAGTNYGFTRFVGRQAKQMFIIDQNMNSGNGARDDG